MASNLSLLGAGREFKGGQVAELGHWLVVYKNNKPVSLYSTGVKIRKFIRAPVMGATVSSLNSSPQEISCVVRDVVTSDDFTVPSVTVRLQVRLTPENSGAAEVLLRQINLHGARFFDSTEADILRRVEQHVRTRVGAVLARNLLHNGPTHVVFETNDLPLERPDVTVTSIQGVDLEEGSLAREVREAQERDVAARAREKLDFDARERAAVSQIHQQGLESRLALDRQANEAELGRRALDVAIDRARRLGLDPVAVAEPDVWREISQHHSDVLLKLLDSQHLYPMLRSSPELMRAIVDRLGGGTTALPLNRQADMILDGLAPERVLRLEGATVYSKDESDAYIERGRLLVDPAVEDAWRRSGGVQSLSGAGYAYALGQDAALVVVLGAPQPSVPASFADAVNSALRKRAAKIGVFSASGTTLTDAVNAFVHRISPEADATLLLRRANEQREVLVSLDGPPKSTSAVLETMTDPANPVLPALESLVGNHARIRFTRQSS